MKAFGSPARRRKLQFGQSAAQPDMGQESRSLVGEDGAEAQDLPVHRRSDTGVHLDDPPQLVLAYDETAVVVAVAAVLQQQPFHGRLRFARGSRRTHPILLHFSVQIVVCHRVSCCDSSSGRIADRPFGRRHRTRAYKSSEKIPRLSLQDFLSFLPQHTGTKNLPYELRTGGRIRKRGRITCFRMKPVPPQDRL